MLSWVPGFDGGKPQYFRLRYRPKDSTYYQYHDVYQAGVYEQAISGLELDTEYYFSIMSYNDMGQSEYRGEFVPARTLSKKRIKMANLICGFYFADFDLNQLFNIYFELISLFPLLLFLLVCGCRWKFYIYVCFCFVELSYQFVNTIFYCEHQ